MQLYFPTIFVRIFTAVPLCMRYCSADKLTTGVKKHATTAQFLFKALHKFIFYSPEFGGWSNKHYATPCTHCSVTCAPCSYVHVRTRALCAFIQSIFDIIVSSPRPISNNFSFTHIYPISCFLLFEILVILFFLSNKLSTWNNCISFLVNLLFIALNINHNLSSKFVLISECYLYFDWIHAIGIQL